MIIRLTEKNFQEEIFQGDTLVEFWGEWCSSCRRMSAVLESLAGVYESKVTFAKLNIHQSLGLANQFGIMSIPTLILFQDGQPVEKITGYIPREELQLYLDRKVSKEV